MLRFLGAFVVAGCLTSCSGSTQADSSGVGAALDSLLALHAQHAVREDIDAVLDIYTEDAIIRSNQKEPIRGHAALRAFFTEVFRNVDTRSLTYRTEEVAVHGDSAWQIATYERTTQPLGQPEETDRGSIIALWIRDAAGAWRIHQDAVNSSMPITAPFSP